MHTIRGITCILVLMLMHYLALFVILAAFRLFGTSMKHDVFGNLVYLGTGPPPKAWQTDGTEETGLVEYRKECETWNTMRKHLLAMTSRANNIAQETHKQSQEIVLHFGNFASEMETVLDEYRQKIDKQIAYVHDKYPNKALKGCCDYLSEMYKEIHQKVRYSAVNIASTSKAFVEKLRNQMSAMFKGLYDKIIRNTSAHNMRECTCDVLARVYDMQQNHLPRIKLCVESYAFQTMKALNGTAHGLLGRSGRTVETVSLFVKSKSIDEATKAVTKEVCSLSFLFLSSSILMLIFI